MTGKCILCKGWSQLGHFYHILICRLRDVYFATSCLIVLRFEGFLTQEVATPKTNIDLFFRANFLDGVVGEIGASCILSLTKKLLVFYN